MERDGAATEIDLHLWLYQHAKTYAQNSADRELSTQFALMLVNFQKFLLICVCVVLLEIGLPEERVNDVMIICFGNCQRKYLRSLRRTAVWMNRLVDHLSIRGWKDRAGELFLLCEIWFQKFVASTNRAVGNRPPSYYVHSASSAQESLDYLTTALSAEAYFENVEIRHGWTALVIPTLIHSLLHKKVS